MTLGASAEATTDVGDSVPDRGAGPAMPTPLTLLLGLIAHVTRLMAHGGIRSFSHFCSICSDFEAQIIRYLFAEARKLDPTLPDVDPDDFVLVWSEDGADFDIVHWSEAERMSQREWLDHVRRFIDCERAWARYRYVRAGTRFKWRTAWRVFTLLMTSRATLSALLRSLAPMAQAAPARAPP